MKQRTSNILSFAAGMAAGAALPVVVPAVAEAGRPMVKALIKHSMLGFDRLRTSIARASESIEDLVAEARAEVAENLVPVQANEPEPARSEAPIEKPVVETASVRPSLVVMS